MEKFITIGNRRIGPGYPPFVIAEIGINHEGEMAKAKQMIEDAKKAGAECVKFQAHVVEDEMVPIAKKIVPGHAKESIWDIMKRCAFSEEED
ncbi:MAG: N-acetylneuraminate synthase family protein, partial [Patescibacteria group bacterium]